MQRYRINYTLLVALFVGLIVAAGVVYGAWVLQTNRNAGNLLARANQTQDEAETIKLLETYVGMRPGNIEAQAKLTELYIKQADELHKEGEIRQGAQYRLLASNKLVKVNFPNDEILRKFVKVDIDNIAYIYTFNKETLSHINTLLADHPNDPELLEGRARCLMFAQKSEEAAKQLYALVGYDPATESFNSSQAIAPDRLSAYEMLAQVVFSQPIDDRALANKVMDQMVAANPDAAEAYLKRGRWLSMTDEGKGSRNDLESAARQDLLKATELDPQSTQAIQQLALHFYRAGVREREEAEKARNDGNVAKFRDHIDRSKELFESAHGYFEQGLALDNTSVLFYSGLADLERARGDKEAAYARLEQGLSTVDERARVHLLFTKAEYQIAEGEFEKAKGIVKEIEKSVPRANTRLQMLQANLLVSTNKWIEARNLLTRLVPDMQGDDRQVQALLWLGMCYQKTAEPEKALKTFDQALELDPTNTMAAIHKQSLEGRRGRRDEPTPLPSDGKVNRQSLGPLLAAEAKKPEAEQNWKPFEQYIDNKAEIDGVSPARRKLMHANLLVYRKKYKEAETLISQAFRDAASDQQAGEEEQVDVLLTALDLLAANPDRGPKAALKMLDQAEERYGDLPPFRIKRVRLLGSINDENLVSEVLKLTENTEGWNENQVGALWTQVVAVFEQTKHVEEAEMAIRKVADLGSGNLPARIHLFKLALARGDDQGMRDAQNEILELVGDKKDTNWSFTEAARLFSLYTRGEGDNATLQQVGRLLTTIMNQRPDWHEPYFLRAKMRLSQNDPLGASQDYVRGFQLGQGTLVDLKAHLQLLVLQQRWLDAIEALDPYNEDVRLAILGESYPVILLQARRYTDAAEAADRVMAVAEPNVQLQLWYSQIMAQLAGVPADASGADQKKQIEALKEESKRKQGEAIAKAIELDPTLPAVWLAQVRFHLMNEQNEEATRALQQAQLEVDDDQQPPLLAECYSMLGRWFDAENLYLDFYEKNPGNTVVERKIAEFYLSQRYPRPDKIVKATRLINSILKKAAEKDESVSTDDAEWARRVAAKMYASQQDYQSLLQAEKLLASNARDGVLPLSDKSEMALILARRPEQVSKRKAIQLIEDVQKQGQLDQQLALTLGQLYFQTDNWVSARDIMDKTTAAYPNSALVRSVYIRMLMTRDTPSDKRALETHLRQLLTIDPNSPSTIELMARASKGTAREKAARDLVRKLAPTDFTKLDEASYVRALRAAQLLTELNDLDNAEALYKKMAGRPGANPGQDGLMLAQFVGIHRDPAQGFEILNQLESQVDLMALIESGLKIIRAHRDEVGESYDQRVETWFARALREDPESIALHLKQGDFRDLQGRYEDAAKIYRQLLDNNGVQGQVRAAVLNNLAYLIALGATEETSQHESAQLINEAASILGPVSDILDTRAVVNINRKDYKSAVEDLEMAVIDAPTDGKYFHLAVAYLGLGESGKAQQAWEKGTKLGLSKESINRLEKEQFDRAQRQIEGLN